jgi:hypothetical protein
MSSSDVITSVVSSGIDPINLWVRAKQSYAVKRGVLKASRLALDSKNRPYMLAGDTYPKTTYYDVASMAGSWAKANRSYYNGGSATLNAAWSDWLRSMPSELRGAVNALVTYDDYSELAAYLVKVTPLKGAMYPNDEAFWGSGKLTAIALSAAGARPTSFSIAVESIKEAIKDRVHDIEDNLPCIRLDCLVPSWVIWGTVGLGGLWLYSKMRKHG